MLMPDEVKVADKAIGCRWGECQTIAADVPRYCSHRTAEEADPNER
jgi:hypothetical protein